MNALAGERLDHPFTVNLLAQAAANADDWLDTLRGPGGVTGPAVHWWQHCLQYTGAGIDWRYEGIVEGYLTLYRKTGEARWLLKARRAANDIVDAQYPSGNYANSQFQLNPYTAGTPHEASVNVALLKLAAALRANDQPDRQTYIDSVRRNLQGYFIPRLWDDQARTFFDDVHRATVVPNKLATLFEALALLTELTGDSRYLEQYGLPALEPVLALQNGQGDAEGAIAQMVERGRPVNAYFPYYNARCITGLVAAYRFTEDARYLDAADRAMRFILRVRLPEGGFPQIVYSDGRRNVYPIWIAGAAETVMAGRALADCGRAHDLDLTIAWVLSGQTESGGFCTARGFAAAGCRKAPVDPPHFFDLLPVAGWAHKAFVMCAALLPEGAALIGAKTGPVGRDCTFRGRAARFVETDTRIELHDDRRCLYRWTKGNPWAEPLSSALLWK
jgi:uncharacterized protein YyaL (SSP411 family)